MNFRFPIQQEAIAIRTIKKYWVVKVQLHSFFQSRSGQFEKRKISYRFRELNYRPLVYVAFPFNKTYLLSCTI